MKVASSARYQNFDYLRVFLALEVVAGHLYAGLLLPGSLWLPIPPVSAFIGLSGFLIPQALERSGGLKNFARNRALRTLPALLPLTLGISLVFGLSSAGQALLQYVSMGYLGDFRGVTLPLWSLMVEDLLYALMALLFVVSLHRSPVAAILIIVALLAIDRHVTDVTTEYRLFQTSIPFFAGSLVNIYRRQVLRLHWVIPAIVILAFRLGWLDMLGTASLALMIAATVALAMTLPQGKWRLPDTSYGIYIWHGPIMIALLDPMGMDRDAAWVVSTLVLSVLVAALSWYLVEKPCLGLKAKPRAGSAPSHPAVAVATT